MQQMGFSSAAVKDASARTALVDQLEVLLLLTQPEVVYTHNPADSHPTHVAVFFGGSRRSCDYPPTRVPKKVYGCEVWRDLDWLVGEDKIALDVSGHPELAGELQRLLQSQMAGGKDYGSAVIGRRRANATFFDSHCGRCG